MHVDQFDERLGIKPLKHSVFETPHMTIESNMTCNMRCSTCYNLHQDYVKPLDEVKAEIDLGMQKRNLEAISLVGGEPTIHPDIIEIVSYIKQKGLTAQILTNGVSFLGDGSDLLLDAIIDAGVDRLVLHIDIGQAEKDEVERRRLILFEKLERRKIYFSLSITVYEANSCMIHKFVKEYTRFKYFDGILAVLERGHINLSDHTADQRIYPAMADEYRSIKDDLGVLPISFIPSNLDDGAVRWLRYYYCININTMATFCFSPSFIRGYHGIYRLLTGKQFFDAIRNTKLRRMLVVAGGLVNALLHPRKMRSLYKVLKQSSMMKALRPQYILIQEPTSFNKETGKLELCYHCPDATIRNGMLTPVCVADEINPLRKDNNDPSTEVYKLVYSHLGEI